MVDLLTPPATITFANHLTKPVIIDARLGGNYMLHAVQVQLNMGLGLIDPLTGLPVLTTAWAYELADFSGGTLSVDHVHGTGPEIYNPTFLTSTGVPINVTWMNMLPTTGGHFLPVDKSIMMGMMGMMGMMDGEPMDPNILPIVVHLHGAHVASIYDGFPTATLTQMDPDMAMTPGMVMASSATYTYDNSQEATMLWYHDHSLGFTRLNVFAGLVGTYLIEDQNRRDLIASGVLPDTLGAFETSLTIADKSFTADGQLYFPGALPDDPLPGNAGIVADVLPPNYKALGGAFPTAVPEYYGDFIMVNGSAWPHAHIGAGQYLYDMVNGSDSRFFTLKMDNPNVKVTIVGTDGGLLPKPITVIDGDGVDEAGEQIILAPGDRLQLLFDFSALSAGERAHLLNVGAAYEPFKGVDSYGNLRPGYDEEGNEVPVTAATTADAAGQIMEFRIIASAPVWHSTMTDDTVLNPNFVTIDPNSASVTRKLGVFETTDKFGRIMPVIGTAEERADFNGDIHVGALGWDQPVTELVELGATEIWEFYNTTADAHPIHMHLGEYQVLGRYMIAQDDVNGDGILIDGYNNDLGDLIDTRADLDGIQNLRPEETGNQDTVWVGPGEALRVIMKFDRPGDYVWHCHILSHEDHDMMRPFKVLGFAGDTIGAISEDATSAALGLMEIGRANPMKQGFIAGDLTGTAGLGTLTLAQNLALPGDTVRSANNGEWSYMVGEAAQALAAGEVVTDVVTVTELDGETTHLISVVVTGQNDAPILAQAIAAQSTLEDTGFIFNVPAGTFTDVDHNDVLTLSAKLSDGSALPSWLNFNAATNSFSGTPPLNYNGDLQLMVTATDKLGLKAESTFQLSITPVNDAPVVSAPVSIAGTQNGRRTITSAQLLANASDVDSVRLKVVALTASPGTLIDNRDGTWDYTPLANSVAPVNFTYQVSDGALSAAGSASLSLVANATSALTIFTGTAAANTFRGSAGHDYVDALAGADDIQTGAGNDIIIAGLGNDQVQGGAGNDIFIATIGDGNDNYQGDAGIDTYDISRTNAGATINLATRSGTSTDIGTDRLDQIENIIGGSGNDVITGDGLANVLEGRGGNDIISAGAGNDTLIGGAGNDILTGGLGNDLFVFAFDSPSYAYDFGNDVITDFQVGLTALAHDTIDLRGLGFTSYADILAHTDAGPNAVIHAGANMITLTGINMTTLHDWDFLF